MKHISRIYTSATKLVFLLIALTVCIALFTGHITSEVFAGIAGTVFGYYYTKATSQDLREKEGVDITPEEIVEELHKCI